MQIEMLISMSELGPFAGDIVDEEKARAVALVQAGYAKWLPAPEEDEEEAAPVEAVAPVDVAEVLDVVADEIEAEIAAAEAEVVKAKK